MNEYTDFEPFSFIVNEFDFNKEMICLSDQLFVSFSMLCVHLHVHFYSYDLRYLWFCFANAS
jgi:hypothetical protein